MEIFLAIFDIIKHFGAIFENAHLVTLRTGSSSYSYSTSSANDYEYEDDGPLPNRG